VILDIVFVPAGSFFAQLLERPLFSQLLFVLRGFSSNQHLPAFILFSLSSTDCVTCDQVSTRALTQNLSRLQFQIYHPSKPDALLNTAIVLEIGLARAISNHGTTSRDIIPTSYPDYAVTSEQQVART
jgi:hypothetical protein